VSRGEPSICSTRRQLPPHLRDFVWGHQRAYCEADRLLEGHRATVQSLAFSPDGRHLVTADEAGSCRVWDGGTGKSVRSFNPSLGRSLRIAFVKDGTVACAAEDGKVAIWDITGLKEFELPGRFPSRTSALAAVRGRWVAAAGAGEVRVWDLNAEGPPTTVLSDPGTILKLLFSRDSETLAAVVLPRDPPAGVRGRVRFWDMRTKQETRALELPAAVRDVAFDRDGRVLAAACGDGTVRLFDAVSRAERRLFQAHDRGATCGFRALRRPTAWRRGARRRWASTAEPTGWLRVCTSARAANDRHPRPRGQRLLPHTILPVSGWQQVRRGRSSDLARRRSGRRRSRPTLIRSWPWRSVASARRRATANRDGR
jgi:WD40 repeat protein